MAEHWREFHTLDDCFGTNSSYCHRAFDQYNINELLSILFKCLIVQQLYFKVWKSMRYFSWKTFVYVTARKKNSHFDLKGLSSQIYV